MNQGYDRVLAILTGHFGDTLSPMNIIGVSPENDYFHLFDYWRWDEDNINSKLVNEYDWEVAPDTSA